MQTTAKLATTFATLTIAAAALAGCTAATENPAAETPTKTPTAVEAAPATEQPTATPEPVVDEVCPHKSWYDIGSEDDGETWDWAITDERVDRTGPFDGANGAADADLMTYTVAPGDAWTSIGQRFCIDSIMLHWINYGQDGSRIQERLGSGELHPGESIKLYPTGDAADYVSPM